MSLNNFAIFFERLVSISWQALNSFFIQMEKGFINHPFLNILLPKIQHIFYQTKSWHALIQMRMAHIKWHLQRYSNPRPLEREPSVFTTRPPVSYTLFKLTGDPHFFLNIYLFIWDMRWINFVTLLLNHLVLRRYLLVGEYN